MNTFLRKQKYDHFYFIFYLFYPCTLFLHKNITNRYYKIELFFGYFNILIRINGSIV